MTPTPKTRKYILVNGTNVKDFQKYIVELEKLLVEKIRIEGLQPSTWIIGPQPPDTSRVVEMVKEFFR